MCACSGRNPRRSVILLWGGHILPHESDLNWCPPWGLSVPVTFLLITLLVLFRLCLLPTLSGLMAFLLLVGSSAGGGEFFCFVPLHPPYPFLLCLRRRSLPYFL